MGTMRCGNKKMGVRRAVSIFLLQSRVNFPPSLTGRAGEE